MGETTYKVTGIPSSFVFGDMKLLSEKGAGEAKLFVGPKSKEKEIDHFFEFGSGIKYRFDKSNLIEYMLQVKMEYVFQSINKYKDANIIKWNEAYSAVIELEDADLYICLDKFVDNSRYYVRANEDLFRKTFRKIVVPKLTDLLFVKDSSKKEIVLYLSVNYEFDKKPEEDVKLLDYKKTFNSDYKQNRIIFGAPGTGKSFKVNEDKDDLLKEGGNYERVTFHSNYSYANFVGTYKPVMVNNTNGQVLEDEKKRVVEILKDKTKTAQEKYDLLYDEFKDDGLTRLPILLGIYTDDKFETRKTDGTDTADNNNAERNHGRAIRQYLNLSDTVNDKKEIAYEYVPGPFMRVLVKALKSAMTDNPKPHLLIVEEINRANPAAVFGDVFQLLDRDSNGVSEYSISTSQDMRTYLAQELGVDESAVETIKIPNNMFIWATMNSADQGVFPMDTAFKRRWDFEYIGIDAKQDVVEKYVIPVGKGDNRKYVYWNELRNAINDRLSSEECKINEDKLLGPFFISTTVLGKATESKEQEDAFVKTFESKVLMYLFEDAMKMSPKKIFKGYADNGGRMTFSKICEAFEKTGVEIFGLNIKVHDELPKSE